MIGLCRDYNAGLYRASEGYKPKSHWELQGYSGVLDSSWRNVLLEG